MGILPMRTTGILPVVLSGDCRAKMALLLTGKMPVLLRKMPVTNRRLTVAMCVFFCVGADLAGCGKSGAPPPASAGPGDAQIVAKIDRSLAAASRYLSACQSKDGAWRSQTYGALRDGPSLSPHVVTCLFFLPASPQQQAAFQNGAAYLESLADDAGGPRADVELLYPVYTAAEISRMIGKGILSDRGKAIHAAWLKYLRRFQMNESLGWQEADAEYGGWGFSPRPPIKPGGATIRGAWDWPNLSATIYGLAALRSAKTPPEDPAFRQALVFIRRCQNYSDDPNLADARFDDGGFFFTPAEPIQNKAGAAGRDALGRQRFHSYGSMTADGLRGLLACGLPAGHPRVAAARGWIARNFSVEHNPGTFEPRNEWMRDATYYYWCWGLSHGLLHLGDRRIQTPGGEVDWAPELAAALLRRQQPDGSWVNSLTEAKEDDPLVATPLAASALAICRHVLAGPGAAAPCAPASAPASAPAEKPATAPADVRRTGTREWARGGAPVPPR